MARRWLQWTIRIVAGIFALLALAFGALAFKNSEGAWLLFAMLIGPLVTNTRPPPMLENQFAHTDLRNRDEISQRLTEFLRFKFPAGTAESRLTSSLSEQGFKSLPPPAANCVPADKQATAQVPYSPCPTYDRSKILQYGWGQGVCGSTITVSWKIDDGRQLTDLKAAVDSGCL
jgi:hypothetical protein